MYLPLPNACGALYQTYVTHFYWTDGAYLTELVLLVTAVAYQLCRLQCFTGI